VGCLAVAASASAQAPNTTYRGPVHCVGSDRSSPGGKVVRYESDPTASAAYGPGGELQSWTYLFLGRPDLVVQSSAVRPGQRFAYSAGRHIRRPGRTLIKVVASRRRQTIARDQALGALRRDPESLTSRRTAHEPPACHASSTAVGTSAHAGQKSWLPASAHTAMSSRLIATKVIACACSRSRSARSTKRTAAARHEGRGRSATTAWSSPRVRPTRARSSRASSSSRASRPAT
jgi:hypothetical protein